MPVTADSERGEVRPLRLHISYQLFTHGYYLDAWRRDRALERLEAGEVTFSRAAEIADMIV